MKIGDVVFVKMGLVPEETYGTEIFVEEMRHNCGKQSKIVGNSGTGWLIEIDDEFTYSDEMLCLMESAPEDRSIILLRACYDLLKKQDNSGYTLDLLETEVFYDEANCDGMCLMEDIETFLSYRM